MQDLEYLGYITLWLLRLFCWVDIRKFSSAQHMFKCSNICRARRAQYDCFHSLSQATLYPALSMSPINRDIGICGHKNLVQSWYMLIFNYVSACFLGKVVLTKFINACRMVWDLIWGTSCFHNSQSEEAKRGGIEWTLNSKIIRSIPIKVLLQLAELLDKANHLNLG